MFFHFDRSDDAMEWFQLDGEPIQIECIRDIKIIDLIHIGNHIRVGMSAASTTEV